MNFPWLFWWAIRLNICLHLNEYKDKIFASLIIIPISSSCNGPKATRPGLENVSFPIMKKWSHFRNQSPRGWLSATSSPQMFAAHWQVSLCFILQLNTDEFSLAGILAEVLILESSSWLLLWLQTFPIQILTFFRAKFSICGLILQREVSIYIPKEQCPL